MFCRNQHTFFRQSVEFKFLQVGNRQENPAIIDDFVKSKYLSAVRYLERRDEGYRREGLPNRIASCR
jgi:hypothetical protein